MSEIKYRPLKEGEIVLSTDEILDDHGNWVAPTNSVGDAAPDPRFTSHRQFRRLLNPDAASGEKTIEERAKAFLDIQTYGQMLPETKRLWTAWLTAFAAAQTAELRAENERLVRKLAAARATIKAAGPCRGCGGDGKQMYESTVDGSPFQAECVHCNGVGLTLWARSALTALDEM